MERMERVKRKKERRSKIAEREKKIKEKERIQREELARMERENLERIEKERLAAETERVRREEQERLERERLERLEKERILREEKERIAREELERLEKQRAMLEKEREEKMLRAVIVIENYWIGFTMARHQKQLEIETLERVKLEIAEQERKESERKAEEERLHEERGKALEWVETMRLQRETREATERQRLALEEQSRKEQEDRDLEEKMRAEREDFEAAERSRVYDEEEEEEYASIAIQALARGRAARKHAKMLQADREEERRREKERLDTELLEREEARVAKELQTKVDAATLVQRLYRGYCGRKYFKKEKIRQECMICSNCSSREINGRYCKLCGHGKLVSTGFMEREKRLKDRMREKEREKTKDILGRKGSESKRLSVDSALKTSKLVSPSKLNMPSSSSNVAHSSAHTTGIKPPAMKRKDSKPLPAPPHRLIKAMSKGSEDNHVRRDDLNIALSSSDFNAESTSQGAYSGNQKRSQGEVSLSSPSPSTNSVSSPSPTPPVSLLPVYNAGHSYRRERTKSLPNILNIHSMEDITVAAAKVVTEARRRQSEVVRREGGRTTVGPSASEGVMSRPLTTESPLITANGGSPIKLSLKTPTKINKLKVSKSLNEGTSASMESPVSGRRQQGGGSN